MKATKNIQVAIWFSDDGEWVKTEYELLNCDEIPATIQTKYRESEYAQWNLKSISQIEYPNDSADYVIQVKLGKGEHQLLYTICNR